MTLVNDHWHLSTIFKRFILSSLWHIGSCQFQFNFLTTSHFHFENFRQIFRVLDLMRMDMTNFVIRNIRPHIQHHLVEYERNKFQEILEETPSMYNTMCVYVKIGSKSDTVTFSCLCCVNVKPLKSWYQTSRVFCLFVCPRRYVNTSYFSLYLFVKVYWASAVSYWEGAMVWQWTNQNEVVVSKELTF